MLQAGSSMQGLEGALGSLLSGSLAKSLLEQQQQRQGSGHLHLGGAGAFGSLLFGVGIPGELGVESSEDLITPANAEVQTGGGHVQPLAAPRATAPSAVLPAPDQHCLFCGSLGNRGACGQLRSAVIEGQEVSVHHLCALWSPGCYLSEGSAAYVNLETEARRARQRICTACGQRGASIPCAHPGCRNSYHLPCAMGAPNVLLESESFELWCPNHSDTDNSDEDYAFTAQRPRRQTGGGSGSKRPRGSVEAQRPRTDWQKKDDLTWLKVVPPWWCEHRTVHFATKVYKELFRSASNAMLVDPSGTEWHCLVHSEARNDLRPQYTLRGSFSELWDALGISAGDTLVFKRDPLAGRIELSRHNAGCAVKAEEALDSDVSDPSAVGEGSGHRTARALARQEASSEHTRGQSQQGSHPNRWMELADGWSIKTVYKSTLAHQQCPIAGWLFKKLYGRLPGDSDKASMFDPDLDAEFRFDVSFISAANVHYITGKTFGGWVRESGLRAGEQIRIKKDSGRVLIQRVPADRKVRVDFTTKAASRSASLAQASEGAAVAGAPACHGQELASPPPAEALEALDALVAAAGYAGTHGTPAIQAALAGNTAAAMAASGMLPVGAVQHGLDMHAMQLTMPPKRRCTGPGAESSAADLLMQQKEQRLLMTRQHAAGPAVWHQGMSGRPATLADWQPFDLHVLMYQAIDQVLAGHQWSDEEQATLQRFRAKYVWLDGSGREMVYMTTKQLQADKAALLSYFREVGKGILTQLPEGAPSDAALIQATQQPATEPGLQGGSPFTAPPISVSVPAAAQHASPFTEPPASMPAADMHQPGEASLMDAVVADPDPRALGIADGQAAIEAAASFNLDAFMQDDREARDTPNIQSALGPLF